MKRALSTSALVIVAAVGGVAACDGVAGPDGSPVSLTFTVPRSSSSSEVGVALQSAATDRAVTVSDGTQRLRVDAMQLNIARIDLERVDDLDDTDTDRDTDWGMDSDRDTDTDEGDNIRFRGPVTVDLPLAGGTITPFRTTIPVGL